MTRLGVIEILVWHWTAAACDWNHHDWMPVRSGYVARRSTATKKRSLRASKSMRSLSSAAGSFGVAPVASDDVGELAWGDVVVRSALGVFVQVVIV